MDIFEGKMLFIIVSTVTCTQKRKKTQFIKLIFDYHVCLTSTAMDVSYYFDQAGGLWQEKKHAHVFAAKHLASRNREYLDPHSA